MTITKRFIAGAVCTSCQAMDTVRSWRIDDNIYRDCVSCGFEEVQSANQPTAEPELATRVNQVPQPLAEDVQVLNFVTPAKRK